jgi:hypothetical protein
MSNSNSNFPPGYVPITTSSLEPGTGNPRESAAAIGQNANIKLANLNSAVGGRRSISKIRHYRKYKGGASSNQIPAPQFQMQYTPTGGPGTSPNNQIANLTSNSMQTNAWSVDDNAATKMGGKKKYRTNSKHSKKGGNLDWIWGCYSGGRTRRNRKIHKSRKYHKKTKHHRRR